MSTDERLEAARIESVYLVVRRVGSALTPDGADDLATDVIVYLGDHRPSALDDANGQVAEKDVLWALEKLDRLALPFGVEHADALQQPFCACGRIKPECDGSRKGCRR